jgi:hypothetical protein
LPSPEDAQQEGDNGEEGDEGAAAKADAGVQPKPTATAAADASVQASVQAKPIDEAQDPDWWRTGWRTCDLNMLQIHEAFNLKENQKVRSFRCPPSKKIL